MANRHLVMLASDFDSQKFKADGSFMSEKMDGFRCLWHPDTRGLPIAQVPFANRERDQREYVCTGLWTRRGKPIMAPAFFLDQLPKDHMLDGELFLGRGMFQKTASVVRKLEPDYNEWLDIRYMLFDIPGYNQFYTPGQVREGGKAGEPAYETYFKYGEAHGYSGYGWYESRRFSETYQFLGSKLQCGDQVEPVHQTQLPFARKDAEAVVTEKLIEITAAGGEGLMLRRGHSIWEPYRAKDLVKVKPQYDSEGTVIGYKMGKGRLSLMIGAFVVRWVNPLGKTVEFELSGFLDSERELGVAAIPDSNGTITESVSSQFPIGTVVTFKYNDLTDDGKPKFARYHRKWEG